MKIIFKIILVFINILILLYSFSKTKDKLPLSLNDFIVSIFAIAGAIYLTDLIVENMFNFIHYINKKINKDEK